MLGFAYVRQWVYARPISGPEVRRRRILAAVFFAWLFGAPWIRIHGQPMLRFDLPGRRLALFGDVLTPSDGVLIMLVALAAALTLFLVTAAWGRAFCAYVCPQSVLQLNLVLPFEHLVEGGVSARRSLDAAPWGLSKAWRKGLKWGGYAVAASAISLAFLGFFVDPADVWTGRAPGGAYAVASVFAALWFLDFVWFREQLCIYLCPYARFQSVLSDPHSYVIGYDARRGEPRTKAARDGRCIDCKACVAVCPQGIDIREGFQLECHSCGRCVDACTGVLAHLGQPTLVRRMSEAEQARLPRRGLIRRRTVAYGGLLSAVVCAAVALRVTRAPFELAIDRAPGTLFAMADDGTIRNTFLVQVSRTTTGAGDYRVEVSGLPNAGQHAMVLHLESSQRATMPWVVTVPPGTCGGTLPFVARVVGEEGSIDFPATFYAPGDPCPVP